MSTKKFNESKLGKEEEMLPTINLIEDYMVNMEGMAKAGITAYFHYVPIPKNILDGVDSLLCCISYPFVGEQKMIAIKIEKHEAGDDYLLVVDSILLAISRAYQELDDDGLLEDHKFCNMWITGLELARGTLILDVWEK